MSSLFDFTEKDFKGNDVKFSDYKGKVLLIVNVASRCGLTKGNYTELQQLHEEYHEKGLEIFAFPCNQFGGQEPEAVETVKEKMCERFMVQFRIMDKVDVNGSKANPTFEFLKEKLPGLMGTRMIKWNFTKFLVDKNGVPRKRFGPQEAPSTMKKEIEALLAEE